MQVTHDRQRRRATPTRSSRGCCWCTTCATRWGSPAPTGAATPRSCGTCVAWLDEEPVKTCTVLAAMADGHRVRTVEGLAPGGTLDPVQEGFMRSTACSADSARPGMMMTARHLLDHNPDPDEATIREAISGKSAGAPATRTSSARSVGRRASRTDGSDRPEAERRPS